MLLMFLIQDVLEKIKFRADLINIDILEKGNKLPFSMLKLPTATSSVLRRLEVQDSVEYSSMRIAKKLLEVWYMSLLFRKHSYMIV